MRDPVCGMETTLESNGGTAQWHGGTFAFCSQKCREKFRVDPEAYVKDPAKDPVCGMAVSEEKNAGAHTCKGKEYLFCSTKCREKFVDDPEAYLHPQPDAENQADASREYTCPMHPEDIQEKGARHILHFEHETFYFCLNQCKETYAHRSRTKRAAKKKGFFAKFLEKLAKDNNEIFGGTPPSCH